MKACVIAATRLAGSDRNSTRSAMPVGALAIGSPSL